MWPNPRLACSNRYQCREMQEADRAQPQSSTTRPPQRNRYRSFSHDEVDSDGDAYHGSDAPVDLLLTSLETYADVQHTTAMHPLPCDCTEQVLSVPSEQMASATYIVPPGRYTHFVFIPVGIERQAEELSITSECAALPRDLLTSERAQARHRLRSIKKMPPPSNLASQVADKIIKYARCIRNTYEKDMCCLSCGLLPIRPVTGPCGHTRCTNCIRYEEPCLCGTDSPDTSNVNIVIQDLIKKTTSDGQSRIVSIAADGNPSGMLIVTRNNTDQSLCGGLESHFGPIRMKRNSRARNSAPYSGCDQRIPMSTMARYNYALELIEAGRHHVAAPHLALAAASAQPSLRPARLLLAQVISILSKNRDPRGLTRPINHLVRNLSSVSWIKPTDIECILCCETFTNPVTTPCGHMFCRTCIDRTMDYNKRCPLCQRDLNDFNLIETGNTVFVQAALCSLNAANNIPPPLEPDLIPIIFVCTVAYPSVPCPLFIFDPRYWFMIRRVLESGSRRFGMVACNEGHEYTEFGTILEVRDCVLLENGKSILSTIGISRFKVIERGVRDGCQMARILPIIDAPPSDDMDIWDLKVLASHILYKAILWLNRLDKKVLTDIENTFGRIPSREVSNEGWWESSHGPSWLWWIVAVLPLRSEIKVLILSTECLLKRMLAVGRTLELMQRVDEMDTVPTRSENEASLGSNGQME